MATGTAWLLNLDAERELAAPESHRPSPDIEARIAALRTRMVLLLRPDDRVIGCHEPGELAACARVLAFCPTPSALARIGDAGLLPPAAPKLSILRRVNSRRFCAALGQPIGGVYVESLTELMALLGSGPPDTRWLLKRDFGFAGRERRRAIGSELDTPTLGFVRNSFARGEGLQVEPELERSHDFALHGYVLPSGELLFAEPLVQVCDARGVWQSSRALGRAELASSELVALSTSCREAGEALAAAGYFGPYGVDAYRYRGEAGGVSFQPRSEINARFSMGYPRALLEEAIARDQHDERT